MMSFFFWGGGGGLVFISYFVTVLKGDTVTFLSEIKYNRSQLGCGICYLGVTSKEGSLYKQVPDFRNDAL